MGSPKTQADLDAIEKVMQEHPEYTNKQAWNAVTRARQSEEERDARSEFSQLSQAFLVGRNRGNRTLAREALEEIQAMSRQTWKNVSEEFVASIKIREIKYSLQLRDMLKDRDSYSGEEQDFLNASD